jgi:hypothetical protein
MQLREREMTRINDRLSIRLRSTESSRLMSFSQRKLEPQTRSFVRQIVERVVHYCSGTDDIEEAMFHQKILKLPRFEPSSPRTESVRCAAKSAAHTHQSNETANNV